VADVGESTVHAHDQFAGRTGVRDNPSRYPPAARALVKPARMPRRRRSSAGAERPPGLRTRWARTRIVEPYALDENAQSSHGDILGLQRNPPLAAPASGC
jgi:hypothetical protein